jgi:hypothetical protein
MTRTDEGFVVEKGSRIQITSQGQNISQNLTSFPFEADCSCSNIPIVVTDAGLSRTGEFRAANVPCHCVIEIIFNFKPDDPAVADYKVTVTEITSAGTTTTIETLPPVTPPPISRRLFVIVTK